MDAWPHFVHGVRRLWVLMIWAPYLLCLGHSPWASAQASAPNSSALHSIEIEDLIDTRRGTDSNIDFSRGNTFAATSVPFGFNMWTPITEADSHSWLYTFSATSILGVAVTHQASPWMGDYGAFQVWPSMGRAVADPKERRVKFSHAHEHAHPYRYCVKLDNDIIIDVAPSNHAAVMAITFPNPDNAYLSFDDTVLTRGAMKFDAEKNVLQATLVARDSSHAPHTFYVVVKLEDAKAAEVNDLAGRPVGQAIRLRKLKADKTVVLRIGTSWISHAHAEHHLDDEVGAYSLKEVAQQGKALWHQALTSVQPEGLSMSQKETFFGNMYRTLLYPNSISETLGATTTYLSPYDNKVHAGDMWINNGFWDTYRAVWPLHFILRPTLAGRMLTGFLDAYRQSGWTPRWSAPGHNDIMVGTHADIIFADAVSKKVPNFDLQNAWEAALKDATVPSACLGRGRPQNQRAQYLGYVPADLVGESAAWHLEDAINDYGIALMASWSGRQDDAEYFFHRARNYQKLFDPNVRFFRGMNADGRWRVPQNDFSPIEWGHEFTEGAAWHYIAPAPFDVVGMAHLYGGHKKLADKIVSMFQAPRGFATGGYGRVIHEMTEAFVSNLGQYAHSNEPVHHMVWLLNALGQPARTQYFVRRILDAKTGLYAPGVGDGRGYIGDEDNGQMSAWYIFASIGLYPLMPGEARYAIGSPLFAQTTLRAEGSKTFRIVALHNSDTNIYVQRATLNGKPYAQSFLEHSELKKGGELVLHMGPKPSQWGVAAALDALTADAAHCVAPLTDFTRATRPKVAHASPAAALRAVNLVDDDSSTMYTDGAFDQEIIFDLGERTSKPVLFYTLTNGGRSASQDPSSWVLMGSSDGQKYLEIDRREHEKFIWRHQLRPFKITRPKSFRFLKLDLCSSDRNAPVTLSEVELLGEN